MKDQIKQLETKLQELQTEVRLLRQENQNLKDFIEHSPDPIVTGDSRGKLNLINKAFTEISGYSVEELKLLNTFDLFGPKQLEEKPFRFDLLEDNKIIVTDRKLLHKSGLEIPVEMKTVKTPNGAYQTVYRDITDRKKNLDELAEKEKKFRMLFENMTNGFALHEMIFDDDGNAIDYQFLEVNPAYEAITGIPAQRIIGKRILELIPTVDPIWISSFAEVVKTGKSHVIEDFLEPLNKYFEILAYRTGKNQFAIIFSDITLKKQSEKKLVESEDRFRKIVENVPVGIGISDLSGKINYQNNVFIKMFGFDPYVINTVEKWAEVAYPDEQYRKQVLDIWNIDIIDVLEGKTEKAPTREYIICDASGNKKNVEISFSIINNDLFTTFNDITNRKQAEEELIENERNFRLLTENSSDLISRHAPDGTFIYATPSFEIALGYKPEELIGTNPYDYFYQDDLSSVKRSHSIITKNLIEYTVEYRSRHKKGHYVWIETTSKGIADSNGNIIEIHASSRDISERKKAEIAFIESKQMLRTLIDSIPDLIYIKDLESRFEVVNKAQADFLKSSVTECVGKTDFDFFPKEQAIVFFNDEQSLVKTGLPLVNKEELINDKNGQPTYFSTNKIAIRNHLGEIIGFAGSGSNITERKKAENALLESQRMLKTVMDSIPLRIFWKDRNSVFLGCNNKLAFDNGLQTPEDVIGKTDFQLSSDQNEARSFAEDDKMVMQTGIARLNFEEKLTTPNGLIWLNTSKVPLRDNQGKIFGVLGTYEDITEKKRTAQALAESEEKFRLLAENLPGVIYMCKNNKNWSTLYMNDSIYQLVGYTKEQFYNEEISFADLYHPEEKEKVYDDVKKALAQNLPFHLIYRIKHFNGSYIWIEEIGDAIRKKGKIQYLEGYLSDITYLKKTEEQLKNINVELEKRVIDRTSQLERVNKELTEFAYVVSHDLKAPLRGINQLAEWLSIDYEEALGNKGTELLGLLKGRVNRLENLINAILEYSRAGRPTVRDESVDIGKIVHVTVEMLCPPSSISIITDSPLPVILNNKIQMGQVFQNLIGNAIKFMDKEKGIIHIGCKAEKDAYLFYVKDNGPGIETKYFTKVFQIFQTLTSRDVKENTGVGLALVKKIIELYEGSIWIESEKGIGCTFTFRLPKQKLHEQ